MKLLILLALMVGCSARVDIGKRHRKPRRKHGYNTVHPKVKERIVRWRKECAGIVGTPKLYQDCLRDLDDYIHNTQEARRP